MYIARSVDFSYCTWRRDAIASLNNSEHDTSITASMSQFTNRDLQIAGRILRDDIER